VTPAHIRSALLAMAAAAPDLSATIGLSVECDPATILPEGEDHSHLLGSQVYEQRELRIHGNLVEVHRYRRAEWKDLYVAAEAQARKLGIATHEPPEGK